MKIESSSIGFKWICGAVGLVLFCATGTLAYYSAHGSGDAHRHGEMGLRPIAAAEPAAAQNTDPWKRMETKPVLSDSYFGNPKVAEAYRMAAELPDVMDQMFCYCYCSKNPKFNHKTLLTCYTEEHAANCDICLKEARMAYEGTKQGKTIRQIKDEIDLVFKR